MRDVSLPPVCHAVPDWHEEAVELVYRVGPFPLWKSPLRLQVTRAVGSGGLNGPQDLVGLPVPAPSTVNGCLLYGHLLGSVFPRRFEVDGWLGYVAWQGEQYVANLRLGVDAWWASFSSKTRSQLRRKIKAIESATGAPLDWRVYRTADEVQAFHRLALPVSGKTYQHKLFDGGLPDSPAFTSRMLAQAEQGHIWAFLLYVGGEPIAYLYLEGQGDVLVYAYVGHDPAQAGLSPGTVLMTVALEYMQAQARYNWFDFGSGETQQKATFATSRARTGHIYLLTACWRHRLLISTHSWVTATNDALTTRLKSWGLHTRLKRWVRAWVSRDEGVTDSPVTRVK
ncbi:MAG: GNAT family N-acetyltransferase [Burkholderiales bacterium]|nr:GNAT family N-acetyltransferase [Burkholderiales bacterium]